MAGRLQHTRKRFKSLPDANRKLPDDLTNRIFSAVENLPEDWMRASYLKAEVSTKFVSSDTDPADVRAQRAINKWLAVECENDATNDRLILTQGEYNILPRILWSRFLAHAQGLILKLLGEVVPVEALFGAFSGGATTTRSRTRSHPALKYFGQAEITSAAVPWFEIAMTEAPLWASFPDALRIVECRGNKMFTVPKSTTIDRVAAKEPDLNMYLQRGVGNYLRRKLRTVGINLNDQSRNKAHAREGSVSNRLATLDLSSASDSVSIGLVELLLPPLWFGMLSDLRSPETRIGDEWHKNNMFSSMGNGFTFELESLLFWAIARTVRDLTGHRGIVSVYGDDLIVESSYAQDLVWVLGYCGFSVNDDKTFVEGPFRESCGGHYYLGYDITPFYVRRPVIRIRDAIHFANQIRKWSEIPGIGILSEELEPLWQELKSYVPPELWGGHDLNNDDQLVSDDPPNRRLVAVEERSPTGAGGYLLWLNACEGSSEKGRDDPIVTSERTESKTRYVTRRIRAERRRPPYVFLAECV